MIHNLGFFDWLDNKYFVIYTALAVRCLTKKGGYMGKTRLAKLARRVEVSLTRKLGKAVQVKKASGGGLKVILSDCNGKSIEVFGKSFEKLVSRTLEIFRSS